MSTVHHEEEQGNETAEKLYSFARRWWAVGAIIVAVTLAFSTVQSNITALAVRQAATEARVQANDIAQQQISVQLSQIQTDISWVKLRLSNK